jgi:hypothetical protein
MASADVATAKPCVPAEAPGMSAETTRMAATKTTVTATSALCPQGHREKKGERRDGHQATHKRLLYAYSSRKIVNFFIFDSKEAACRLPDLYAGTQRQVAG